MSYLSACRIKLTVPSFRSKISGVFQFFVLKRKKLSFTQSINCCWTHRVTCTCFNHLTLLKTEIFKGKQRLGSQVTPITTHCDPVTLLPSFLHPFTPVAADLGGSAKSKIAFIWNNGVWFAFVGNMGFRSLTVMQRQGRAPLRSALYRLRYCSAFVISLNR